VTGAQLADQTARRLTPAIVLSNLGGALVVFVFLVWLLPVQGPSDPYQQRLVNAIVFVPFMVACVVLGHRWGDRIARPVGDWLESEQPATAEVRRAVLRQPLRQMHVNGTIWLAAAVVFGLLNVPYSVSGAVDIVTTIVFGAFTTCTIAYLLSERILRPVVSLAMVGSDEPPPVLLGVKPRLLLAWGVGTGIPLVGIGMGVASVGGQPPLSRAGIGFLVVLGVVVGLGAITAAAGAVSDPVRSVAAALRQVGEGNLDVAVPVYDASEVGRLQSGFNAMVHGLRERDRLQDLFGRQVGDAVAARALEHGVELGGETREVAVLFVDVVGSTTLAVTTDPQEVVRRLNAFFSVVVEVVSAHDGWVNKFEGDAALCIFGAPLDIDDAATSALRAARQLAVRLAELPVDAAIGVAAGPVVAGNVGAESRFEYTVIGDPVNVAARLTELAKTSSGCVLADAALLAVAAPDEVVHWTSTEQVLLRGRHEPTALARPGDQ
jgi:adenylate cyclase